MTKRRRFIENTLKKRKGNGHFPNSNYWLLRKILWGENSANSTESTGLQWFRRWKIMTFTIWLPIAEPDSRKRLRCSFCFWEMEKWMRICSLQYFWEVLFCQNISGFIWRRTTRENRWGLSTIGILRNCSPTTFKTSEILFTKSKRRFSIKLNAQINFKNHKLWKNTT